MAYEGKPQRLHPTCQRCGGERQEGFIPDFGYASMRAASGVEGQPIPSFWHGVCVTGAPQFPIVALRYKQCGALEFFALEPMRGRRERLLS